MGLDVEAARFLLSCRRSGVVFERCLTLGRQYFLLGYNETRNLLREYGHEPARYPKLFVRQEGLRYSEPFWEVLGAEHLDSIDAANYEGATVIHDLNQPIPARLKEQYDVVCEAGTLEHIYDFPTVIRNCMEMVKVGGHFIGHINANNLCGHGFYQFSPELLFRVFCPENGYQTLRLYAVEYGPRYHWYEVADPAVIQCRVTLYNTRFPVSLFMLARRINPAPPLAQAPQQSDYTVTWAKAQTGAGSPQGMPERSPLGARLRRWVVETAPGLARWLAAWETLKPAHGFGNRRYFKKVDKHRI
jgi:hypothetical protein